MNASSETRLDSRWHRAALVVRSRNPWAMAVAATCAILCVACGGIETKPGRPSSFDPERPFGLRLWTGNMLEGFEALVLDENGTCTRLRRALHDRFEQASRVLAVGERRSIAEAAQRCGVREWMHLYEDHAIADDEQWIVAVL